MPDSTPIGRDLERVLARFIDGEPEPADFDPLMNAIQKNPTFAVELRRSLHIDEIIRQHFRANAVDFVEGVALELDDGSGVDLAARMSELIPVEDAPRPVRRQWALPWIIATVACLAVAVQVFRAPKSGQPPLATQPSSAPSDVIESPVEVSNTIALLVNESGAKFADESKPDSVRFYPGEFKLTEGVVHLRFLSGVDVVIPAPADFRIKNSMHLALDRGSIRAIVAPEARGFTIDAPGICYEDLGTEFGVSVNPTLQRSEVHVFDGAVDIKSLSGEKLSSLTVGDSASVADGLIGAAVPPDLDLYPGPSAVGFRRWRQWQKELLKDESVLRHFSFDEVRGDASQLLDLASGSVGTIRGARWVSGRWPQKQGLLFDRNGDAVEINIPGEHRELTIAAWIRPERFDHSANAILNSDGWEDDDIRFQLQQDGTPVLGFLKVSGTRKNATARVDTGVWSHVAAVISVSRGVGELYINGVLANKTPFKNTKVSKVVPGSCRIGDWLPLEGSARPERGFCGRIDEFTVWSRSLSESELTEQVEHGRPSLLPRVSRADRASSAKKN